MLNETNELIVDRKETKQTNKQKVNFFKFCFFIEIML